MQRDALAACRIESVKRRPEPNARVGAEAIGKSVGGGKSALRARHTRGSCQAPQRATPSGWRRSPLCHWPESFADQPRAVSAYTIGGSSCSAFQSVVAQAVRLPESFRGGCSFGGRLPDSLPLVLVTYPARDGGRNRAGKTHCSRMVNARLDPQLRLPNTW